MGREALDAAHAAIRPGITTDEIDRIVGTLTKSGECCSSSKRWLCLLQNGLSSVLMLLCSFDIDIAIGMDPAGLQSDSFIVYVEIRAGQSACLSVMIDPLDDV